MSPIEQEIMKIVRQRAQLDHDPDPAANLVSEAGIDSLMALRILASVEETFSVRIPDDQLVGMTSIQRIAAFVEKSRS